MYQDNIKAVNKYLDCAIRCLLLGYVNLNSNEQSKQILYVIMSSMHPSLMVILKSLKTQDCDSYSTIP